jgi:hypothetical protein
MTLIPPFAAGIAYFVLGGLWFTPLFGKAWDRAVGFERPAKWRPPLPYYLGPLVGCLVVAAAISVLLRLSATTTYERALGLGLVVGAGLTATVTAVNAISPNVPRPALYAAVVGGYHLVGAVLCAAIIHGLSVVP